MDRTFLNWLPWTGQLQQPPAEGPRVEINPSIYRQRAFHWGTPKRAARQHDRYVQSVAERQNRVERLPDGMRIVFYNRDSFDEAAIVFTDRYGAEYQKILAKDGRRIPRFVDRVLRQADTLARKYRLH